jgi:poly(hydroxyalkanoate) depolymerase family esterase
MDMNEMLKATRLIRTGEMMEATALIQRALRGMPTPNVAANDADAATDAHIIDGDFRVIDIAAAASSDDTHVHEERTRRSFKQFRDPLTPNWQEYFENIPGPTRAPRKQDVEPGGRFVSGTYTNHAGTRGYKLYIPSCYHGQTLPLVVMLHGCTQNPDDFAAGTRMNLLAEEHQCFVVYPAQTQAANRSKCWNWFNPTDQQRDQGEPSLIAGITRQIINTFSVDPRQVYVAGLSAGGAMAAVMGITYSDLYAATGVHSGLPYAAARDLPSAFAAMRGAATPGHAQRNTTLETGGCRRAVPTIVFHGDRDVKVHPRNGDQVIAQWTIIHNRTQIGAGKPRVTIKQGQVPNGHAYSRATYHDANGQTMLEHWQIHGAGHAWSGGSSSGSYTDPRGPDAAREMMRFFYEHPRPEITERSASEAVSTA